MLEIKLNFEEVGTTKDLLEKCFLEPLAVFIEKANGGLGDFGLLPNEQLDSGESVAGHMDDDNEKTGDLGHNTSFRFWESGAAMLDLNLDASDPPSRFNGTWEEIAVKMMEEIQRRIAREAKKYEQLEKMATAAKALLG